jgi:transcriptional regulator of acetoin/glycerol metabolism
MERAVILSTGDTFEPDDFNLGPTAARPDARQTAHQELNLEKLERDAIHQALTEQRYNISRAAKALGLTRAALYRRMEKHGL